MDSKNRIVRYDDGKPGKMYNMANRNVAFKVTVKISAAEFEGMTNAQTLELKKEIQKLLNEVGRDELSKVFIELVERIRPARGFAIEIK